MNLSRVIRISRPRFWIYELWPYMIGILAAIMSIDCANYGKCLVSMDQWVIILFALYFLIFANIWIYGINDIYDYETDKLNPKKLQWYEALVLPSEQTQLWKRIITTTIPFIILVMILRYDIYTSWNILYEWATIYSFFWFLFFSWQYSAYPIRAKAKPIIDMIFSAGHYVMTAVFAWTLIAPIMEINWRYVVAGMCWCMAMHLYSAIPDIQADAEAWLSTTAMLTWERGGLILCVILYALAAVLSVSWIGIISLILWAVYLIMMIWTWVRLRDISQIYRYFPWVNMVSGMCIFLVLLYSLIYG
jgi:lycopene elongase/hydratase (dihydrobisanhydrobacterioruberin-forming)